MPKRLLTIILILSSIFSCNKQEKMSDFQSIHLMNKSSIEAETEKITGQHIEKVFYVIANYQERENIFDKFDIVDEAIFIQLSNNKGISWVWSDDGPEMGYHYGLYYNDLKSALKKRNTDGIEFLRQNGLYEKGIESEWSDVTNSRNWNKFIGKKLENIQFRTQKTNDGKTHISDFTLDFGNESITIYSKEEPEPDDYTNIKDLVFAPDWTIVVFNKEILN